MRNVPAKMMNRIPALDGLRGIAVGMVMLLHLVNFRQGWIGVDIFFALSGYLITGILLQERNDHHFWTKFYVRRVTRIVPPFVLLLLLATLSGRLAWRILWPYLLFFGANVASARFEEVMLYSGVSVLWSLSVEEHFYFVWPFQVRRFSTPTLTAILLGILVTEPVVRCVASWNGVPWIVTYLLTPFRLDGLAAGSLLAIAMQSDAAKARLQAWAPRALACTALTLMVTFPLFAFKAHPFFCNSVGNSLLALFSVSMLAHLLFRPSGLVARLLSLQPLVFLGRVSYGLYLFHMIVSMLVRRAGYAVGYMHGEQLNLFSVPVTILFSWVSFRYVESYFLGIGKRRVSALSEEQEVAGLSAVPVHDAAR